MEDFCNTLHPSLRTETSCVEWFHQATEHCAKLVTLKNSRNYLLKMLKNFLFPKRNSTNLLPPYTQIPIDPQRLEMENCYCVFVEFAKNYIMRRQQFAAESSTYFIFLQIMLSLFGVMILGVSLLLIIIYFYCKHNRPTVKLLRTYDIFEPEKCLQVIADRSLRMAREELRRLDIIYLEPNDEIFECGKIPILVLKAGSQPELLNDFASSKFKNFFRLWQLQNQLVKLRNGSKAYEMKLLNRCSGSLRLLILFVANTIEEEIKCENISIAPIESTLSLTESTNSRRNSNSLIPLRCKLNSAISPKGNSNTKKRNVRFSLAMSPAPPNHSPVPSHKTAVDKSRSLLPIDITRRRNMNPNDLHVSLPNERKFRSATELKRKKTVFSLPSKFFDPTNLADLNLFDLNLVDFDLVDLDLADVDLVELDFADFNPVDFDLADLNLLDLDLSDLANLNFVDLDFADFDLAYLIEGL
uniref:Uncharacterized protein n=1 Tax=Glossina brevipalpis TaxID=37001 RepID=A0A1A9WYK4_9MUSC